MLRDSRGGTSRGVVVHGGEVQQGRILGVRGSERCHVTNN